METLNGKGNLSNASLKGKVAIVDFWATWCGPCKQSFPKFEELSKKHGDDVTILAISVDDEKAGVAEWAKENGATFPIAWDADHSIANRWGVKSMPTTYILDAEGKVRYVHAGFHDDEPAQIAKELTALLEESPSRGKGKGGEKERTEVASAAPPPAPAAAPSPKESTEEEPAAAPKDEEADPGAKKGGKPGAKGGKGKGGGKKGGKPRKKK